MAQAPSFSTDVVKSLEALEARLDGLMAVFYGTKRRDPHAGNPLLSRPDPRRHPLLTRVCLKAQHAGMVVEDLLHALEVTKRELDAEKRLRTERKED